MHKLLFILLFLSSSAYSYTNFIGYGYGSCLTCHYNAFGNGPLNDYGRALGASLIAGKTFRSKNTNEEMIAERSGFFFSRPKQTWFRPSLDYRGLYLARDLSSSQVPKKYIHMQADANAVFKFLEDKIIVSGTIGLAPEANGDGQVLYSREHYVQYRISEKHRVYVGKTDHLFGLRIPDHTVAAKRKTGLAENDQTYGLTYHWYNEKIEGGAQVFIGDVLTDADTAAKGVSSKHEYKFSEKLRIGASVLFSSAENIKRTIFSAHSRMGFPKGSSLIAELGMQNAEETIQSGQVNETKTQFLFLQNQYYLARGLNFLQTFDYHKSDSLQGKTSMWQLFLGLQWFPMPRVEMRLEFGNSRFYGVIGAAEDRQQLLLQNHIWF